MTAFSEPTKWAQALGATANADVIPDEAGATDVDISKIFPAVFSVPLSQGGKAIPRKTLNGIFKTLGEWVFYNQNGGVPSYNADFDYTVGRLVSCNGSLFKCIQNNVHTAPHNPTEKDYWAELSDSSSSTGLLPNQIIISPVPMSDANLHLLDGSLLTSGVYAEYVAMMIRLYNADPTAPCWISEADWQANVTTYGECGKFVVDTENNTVRLPKITSFIQATSTASELGQQMEAGLPNVEGKAWSPVDSGASAPYFPHKSGAFYSFANSTKYNSATLATTDNAFSLGFDASLSNPIYGNSPTVQIQSTKYYFYIVIGTVSKTPVQVEIDNIATDLNGKADTDFSNVTNTAKIAMAHNAMPSGQYVDLTLGASGATYTAPADGYLLFDRRGSGSGSWAYITNQSTSLRLSADAYIVGYEMIICAPVKKNDVLRVEYNTTGELLFFRFFYAVGSESEKA